MIDAAGIDWEDAFANATHVPGGDGCPDRWRSAAAAFRRAAPGRTDVTYGAGSRAQLDLFVPDGRPKGLVVFIHGGFRLAFDKSFWSRLAAGPLAHGRAAALPSCTLAPDARISGITAQIGQAIAHAAGLIDPDHPLSRCLAEA